MSTASEARATAALRSAARALTLEAAGGIPGPEPAVDVLALHEALGRLAEIDARKSHLVELRYFGGREIDEAAAVLGISSATVKREWTTARAWLKRELSEA